MNKQKGSSSIGLKLFFAAIILGGAGYFAINQGYTTSINPNPGKVVNNSASAILAVPASTPVANSNSGTSITFTTIAKGNSCAINACMADNQCAVLVGMTAKDGSCQLSTKQENPISQKLLEIFINSAE